MQESLRGRLAQEESSGQAAENAGQHQRNHHAARNFQLLGIGATARGGSYPQSQSVGGISGDGRNAGKQKCGEGDETSATRDSVDSAAEGASEKQEDGGVQVQTKVLSRMRLVRQSAQAACFR